MGRKDKDKNKEKAAKRDDDQNDHWNDHWNDPGPSDKTLVHLERLARLMRQQGHGHGLNPAQWEVLRYLHRANRLSNTPGALARYLGSTKGTVSQTLASLEAKGLVVKLVRDDDGRSVALSLSEAGSLVLQQDGLKALGADIDELRPKIRKRFDKAIEALLRAEVQRQGEPSFGTCATCRYFREATSNNAAYCMKVDATLPADETALICVEQVDR